MSIKNFIFSCVFMGGVMGGCGFMKAKREETSLIPVQNSEDQFKNMGSLATALPKWSEPQQNLKKNTPFQRCLDAFKDYAIKHVDADKGIIETEWKEEGDKRHHVFFHLTESTHQHFNAHLHVVVQTCVHGQWIVKQDPLLEAELWSKVLKAMAPC